MGAQPSAPSTEWCFTQYQYFWSLIWFSSLLPGDPAPSWAAGAACRTRGDGSHEVVEGTSAGLGQPALYPEDGRLVLGVTGHHGGQPQVRERVGILRLPLQHAPEREPRPHVGGTLLDQGRELGLRTLE